MIPAVIERCAGIDVGKQLLTVCVMVGPAEAEPSVQTKKFGTFNGDLESLKKWLSDEGCTHAVMESTGPYWKPIFNVLEDQHHRDAGQRPGCEGAQGSQDGLE